MGIPSAVGERGCGPSRADLNSGRCQDVCNPGRGGPPGSVPEATPAGILRCHRQCQRVGTNIKISTPPFDTLHYTQLPAANALNLQLYHHCHDVSHQQAPTRRSWPLPQQAAIIPCSSQEQRLLSDENCRSTTHAAPGDKKRLKLCFFPIGKPAGT